MKTNALPLLLLGLLPVFIGYKAFRNSAPAISPADHLPQLVVKTTGTGYITSNRATAYYTINKKSTLVLSAHGICVSKGAVPTIANTRFGPGKGSIGPVNFYADITGLSPVTKYYIRAYAMTSAGNGLVYGEILSFTTAKVK